MLNRIGLHAILILAYFSCQIFLSQASISANFVSSNSTRMVFMVNFDTASVICQKSANPEDLALFPISELCNGVRQCLAAPNMDDESFPFCSHNCNPACGPRGTCLLDGGKAQCYCDQGYSGKDCTVEDTNECAKKPCHWLAKCTNTHGSYYCSCLPGFSGDGVNCTDIDECAIDSIAKKCPSSSECSNVPGSYFCNCTDGYKPRGQPVQSCDDIDECAEKLANCPSGSICLNTPGSYKCVPQLQDAVGQNCQVGYEQRDGKCRDINECHKPDACAPRASCWNSDGGYTCVCPVGFTGDGKTCTPLTDCSTNPAVCHPNAFCVSDLRMCLCQSGYIGDGITCYDMNECVSSQSVCKSDEKCVNTNGSFVCCPRESNERACLQAHGAMCSGGCGQNAECMAGRCFCKEGYSGDPNVACSDINECRDNPNICPLGEWCVNFEGGHVCCHSGSPVSKCQGLVVGVWSKKDKSRTPSTPSFDQVQLSTSSTPASTSSPLLTSTSSSSEKTCSQSQLKYCELRSNKTCSIIDGHPECSGCLAGFVAVAGECIPSATPSGRSECHNPDKNDCHQYATCLDLSPSGRLCACKDGFIGDGKRCDDVDECYTPNLCSPNATCVNQIGSYTCACKPGYAGDGRFCTAVCPGGGLPHLTSGPCTPVRDSCPSGFVCQDQHCCPSADVAVNCESNPRICGEHGKCVNKQCECDAGFQRIGSRCVDLEKNCSSACSPGSHCVNGSCVMVDPIDCRFNHSLCHPNAQCNSTGDGRCFCVLGYLGDGLQCKPDPEDCYLNIALCDLSRSRCVDRRCRCLDGFRGNGTSCQLESCQGRFDVCHRNADCQEGQCACKDGFVGNGITCVPDPNDCQSYPNLCHGKGTCTMRRCHCIEGYEGDGVKSCTKMENVEFDPRRNTTGNQSSSRNLTSGSSSNRTLCIQAGVGDCHADADCVTVQGGKYACQCRTGYSGDGKSCQDIDECSLRLAKCHPVASCVNKVGGHMCVCPPGSTGDGVNGCDSRNGTRTSNRLDVECQDDGMVLVYNDPKNGENGSSSFNGRIFVKTQSRNQYCSRDFTSADGPVYKFKAPFSYCDVKTEPHNTFSTVVVIQKHPLFVTDADEAYNLRCTYPVGEVPLMSHFNVSMLSTAGTYVNNGTTPQCNLRVLAQPLNPNSPYGAGSSLNDSLAWQEVSEATVGQRVQLLLNVEPKTLYGIVAKNCMAVNMDSGESYQLTNSHGCAVDPAIFPDWTQEHTYQLSAKFLTFKWPDTAHIRFQCDCSPCFEQCDPVQCGSNVGWGRRRRSIKKHQSTEDEEEDQPTSSSVFSSVLKIKDNGEWWQEENEEEDTSNRTVHLLSISESNRADGEWEDICINSVIFASALGLAVSLAASVFVIGIRTWQRGQFRSLTSGAISISSKTSTSLSRFKHWTGLMTVKQRRPVTVINQDTPQFGNTPM